MSAAPTAPATPAPGESGAPAARHIHPAPTGLVKVTAIVATIGVVVAIAGFLLLLRPVSTPTQDCGTVAGFLLDGRSNVYLDPNDLPKGVTAAEAKANNARPCRERVADQTKPGAVALLSGLTVAIGASLVEMTARGLAWRRRRRARPPR